MRHRVAHRKLGRKSEHRKSLLRNLCTSLITHERIITTLPKAKELRPYAERVITLGKRALAAEARRLWPDVAMVASHQITREWREYERTNTTVLSAYVQPIAESYL